MTFHPKSITKQQRSLLGRLGKLAAQRDFYLAGGTAVALHLGHRMSVDLDWFVPKKWADPPLWTKQLQDAGFELREVRTAQGTFHGTINGVKNSFFEYPYPLLSSLVVWDETGCALAALPDLASMKLMAIAQRGSRKDFIDLYALGSSGIPLKSMLEWYQEKYSESELSLLFAALTYFDDAEQQPMPKMLSRVSWKEMRKTITSWVKKLI